MAYIFNTLMYIMIFTSITLGLIHYILKKNYYLIKIKIKFFLICLAVMSIRMLIPIDFPMVHVFKVTAILPNVYTFLKKPFLFTRHIGISPFDLLTLLWALGAILCIIKKLYFYKSTKEIIHKLSEPAPQKTIEMLNNILKSYTKPKHFHLIFSERISVPCVFGIFKPCIILPNLNLADDEYYYILCHEIAHYYHGDLLIKFVLEIFHALCWWNPLYYYIKGQTSKLLEINVDVQITQNLNQLQQLCYLQCLLKLAKREKKSKSLRFISAFNNESATAISRRIHIVLAERPVNKAKCFPGYAAMLLLLSCVLIFPNFFTFTSYSIPSEVQEKTFAITKDNAFFIVLENETFDLYVNKNFIINTTTTVLFEETIPIYHSLEEALYDE